MVSFLENAKSMPVIITSAKRKGPARMADINNKLIEKIESFGHRVAVMEDFVIPGVQFGQCINRPDILVPYNYLKSLCAVDPEIARKDLKYNRALQSHSHHYISVDQEQCIDGDCVFIDDQGKPTHRDDHHLSIDGSIYLLSKLVPGISSALNINAGSQE